MIPDRTQLLAARLRAEGAVPSMIATGADVEAAATAVGRRVVRFGTEVRWGWANGHDPDPEGPECAGISTFATMLLAALLGLCWQDPSDEPYPGESVGTDVVDRLAAILDRDRKIIQKFLGELRAAGLVAADGQGGFRLGPQVATWSPRLVNALRRQHHVFAAAARDGRSDD